MTWHGRETAVPLVAVAHGSRDPRAAATVEDVLALVRRARPDLPVRAAYLDHTAPTLAGTLTELTEAAVVPLLLTEAYHSRVDIPAVLAELTARRPLLRVHRGATLGPHPLLVTALERRLAEAGVRAGDPRTAVVLVSAGSSDRRANATVSGIAGEWAGRRGWWSVTAAYASAAEPTPGQEVRRLLDAGAPRVVVAPYLLAPGHFAEGIRRDALAAGAEVVADVLGAAPELAAVLIERYERAVRATAGSATA
ncbi:sirohydrochlorin chelatase [Streptosporangium sp. NBC_01756]|uniref:sirohydrochlorin chelatase n=1 Tax=Streptosporangium sp. NBC_01756 TaxID=2975950 RepID=UPI002DD8332A|nr:sirohydrochlorin chelatase [Streptosporangium sp. NBC_01756]WSC87722.1 sirohydrochlorin chelatase [Streptosporangium sp. NBC_01756]